MNKWGTNIEPFVADIEEWAGRGASEKEIAGKLGVGYSTFRRYAKEQQELKAALKRGKRHARTVVNRALSQSPPASASPSPRPEYGAPGSADPPPVSYPGGGKGPARPDQQGRHRGPYERNKKRIYRTQEVCGICGRPVDKSLKYPHPLSPCIDHIVPVAKGGHPSDISNLQLAHWTCNRQKSDKLLAGMEASPKKIELISNRVLPHSMDWTAYRSGK